MSIRDIDKVNGRVIRKLVSPDGQQSYGYVSGVVYDALGNMRDVQKHPNLTEARAYCGFVPNATVKTLPKSAYPQNRKGYKAGVK